MMINWLLIATAVIDNNKVVWQNIVVWRDVWYQSKSLYELQLFILLFLSRAEGLSLFLFMFVLMACYDLFGV